MKRLITIILTFCLVFVMASCAINNPASSTPNHNSSKTESKTTNTSQPNSSDAGVTPTPKEGSDISSENAVESNNGQVDSHDENSPVLESSSNGKDNTGSLPKPETPNREQYSSSEESQTPPPVKPESPVEPTKAPEPAPTEPPPAEPEPPAFNVDTWVDFAKNYGQSIGLNLDGTATSCWDNPNTANSSCIYLERDITGMLNWYKDSGMTAFWVWSEDLGAGEYLIYIGYA